MCSSHIFSWYDIILQWLNRHCDAPGAQACVCLPDILLTVKAAPTPTSARWKTKLPPLLFFVSFLQLHDGSINFSFQWEELYHCFQVVRDMTDACASTELEQSSVITFNFVTAKTREQHQDIVYMVNHARLRKSIWILYIERTHNMLFIAYWE